MPVLEYVIIGHSAEFPLIDRSFTCPAADTISDGFVEKLRICVWHVESG
jgi:hypothetical protein